MLLYHVALCQYIFQINDSPITLDNIGGSLKYGECFGKCELENTFACNVWCANVLKHNISTHVHSELSPQLPLSVITFAMFCDVVYSK